MNDTVTIAFATEIDTIRAVFQTLYPIIDMLCSLTVVFLCILFIKMNLGYFESCKSVDELCCCFFAQSLIGQHDDEVGNTDSKVLQAAHHFVSIIRT